MSNIDSNSKQGTYQLGQNHMIESLWLQFHNTDHNNWILQPEEAILLHEKVKQYNPKLILELGTGIGCSTAIMAFSSEAHIYTVEQNQKCIDLAKKLIPNSFQERIYFKKATVGIVSPVYEVNPFQWWLGYGEYDWIDYDFIMVDGPGPIKTKVKNDEKSEIWEVLAELPGCDVLFALDKMKPGTKIYVDKRKLMTMLWDRHLSSYLTRLEVSAKHSLYERTDVPLAKDFGDFKNSDISYAGLQKGGYFD